MRRFLTLLTVLAIGGNSAFAQEKSKSALDPETAKKAAEASNKAVAFLKTIQNQDGSFGQGDFAVAMTALATAGALGSKQVTPADPMAANALKFLESSARADGAICSESGAQKNYCTAIAVIALAEANKDGKYKAIIDKAATFLKTKQWDEGENTTPKDPRYGGAGYGGKNNTRPDLSNTAFMVEALKASGLPPDDPAFKRAAIFITRCQNYSGEGGNDMPIAKKINDGGFFYTNVEDYNPANKDPKTLGDGLRSYGSMTYAGLKSFLYAGVDKNDPRVKAAVEWAKKNYTLAENPGMGQTGMYYYFHTFAKAMDVMGIDTFEDAKGVKHDWRKEFVDAAVAKQLPNGSWKNTEKRWFEDQPLLVTSYMLMALGHVSGK